MLDDLKKERHAANPGKDLFKMAIYVVAMLMFGITIFAGSRCSPTSPSKSGAAAGGAAAQPPGPTLDAAELTRLVEGSGAEPYRYSAPGLEYALRVRRKGHVGAVSGRLDAADLAALPLAEARGKIFDVVGQVTEVTREVYKPTAESTGAERLWSVVLEGRGGAQAVVISHALESEQDEGHPREAKPTGVRAEPIAVGQWVVARGVYVQQRTGSLGGASLPQPAPALLVSGFRILLPPEDWNEPVAALGDALWEDVQDRYSRESRRWDEDAVFETIQWARARGYEACRDDIEQGRLPWRHWGAKTFETWKKEVSVRRDDPRPFTEASRGTVFRTPGIVGEVLQFDWETIPPNRWNVDEFQLLRILSDHYQHISVTMIMPFPIATFEGVTGAKGEHVYVYGVFVKNETYDSQFKREDGTQRALPITAPMFVVLHMEPFPEAAAAQAMRNLMWWIAGSMVVFGLLFYVVLIRGGRKQVQRMEEHRLALRQRIRAKGQGPTLPSRGSGKSGAAGDSESLR